MLPTKDGVQPPWGAPVQLNNAGELIGTTYVRVKGISGYTQHGIVWHART